MSFEHLTYSKIQEVKKFRDDLRTNSKISQADIKALESKLGYNLITSKVRLSNFTLQQSSFGLEDVTLIVDTLLSNIDNVSAGNESYFQNNASYKEDLVKGSRLLLNSPSSNLAVVSRAIKFVVMALSDFVDVSFNAMDKYLKVKLDNYCLGVLNSAGDTNNISSKELKFKDLTCREFVKCILSNPKVLNKPNTLFKVKPDTSDYNMLRVELNRELEKKNDCNVVDELFNAEPREDRAVEGREIIRKIILSVLPYVLTPGEISNVNAFSTTSESFTLDVANLVFNNLGSILAFLLIQQAIIDSIIRDKNRKKIYDESLTHTFRWESDEEEVRASLEACSGDYGKPSGTYAVFLRVKEKLVKNDSLAKASFNPEILMCLYNLVVNDSGFQEIGNEFEAVKPYYKDNVIGFFNMLNTL